MHQELNHASFSSLLQGPPPKYVLSMQKLSDMGGHDMISEQFSSAMDTDSLWTVVSSTISLVVPSLPHFGIYQLIANC
jgi:hypothetical protein